jgi:hypothetical protein
MAYFLNGRANKGPYPNLAGECCGAWHPDHQPAWFDQVRYRLGRPRPESGGRGVAELEAIGWRGIYLLADINPASGLMSGDGPVELTSATPEELQEPAPDPVLARAA